MAGLGLIFLRRGGQAHPTAGSDYILSETKGDAEVFRILMEKGVSSDGIGITKEDAAAVTSISTWFRNNTTITSFDELRYFTGVTTLGTGPASTDGAFYGCTNLQSVILPSSVTWLRTGCFQNCTSLQSVGDLSNVRQIDVAAFRDSAIGGEIDLSGLTASLLGYSAFQGTLITKVLSLGNTQQLGGSTPIGNGAFGRCSNLAEINFSNVKILVTGCCSYATALEEVILPDVTDIQLYAFYQGGIKKIDIGSSVTHIGVLAFANNSTLQAVIIRATTPPTLDNVSAFQSTNNCPIYVPDEAVDAYQAATNWSSLASRIKGISEYTG